MKDLKAKDLEKIFSKKQLSSYNRKLKTEYYILKQKYDKAIDNVNIARKMLKKNSDISSISEITDLSISEIEEIKEEMTK